MIVYANIFNLSLVLFVIFNSKQSRVELYSLGQICYMWSWLELHFSIAYYMLLFPLQYMHSKLEFTFLIVDTEPFRDAFGPKGKRKRPKLLAADYESLVKRADGSQGK